jgi:hypothetical protein
LFQPHNSYVIIDLLLNHLEQKETTHRKTSIMNVIHDYLIFTATNIAAGKKKI